MTNIYEQINDNKRRSILVITLFVVFFIVAAYLINYFLDVPGAIPLAIFVSLFSSGASYFWGDKIVLGLNGAVPANRREHFDFYTVAENLSLAAQIPTPKLYVIPSDSPNAFATGRDPEHAIVCTTTGLLNKLNRTELEGVIAHELSHVKNFDTRLMTIVSILVGSLSILINISTRDSLFHHRDNDNQKNNSIFMILGLLTIIFAPLVGQLIQLAISRRREFFADASAVMITRQPSGLINALKKISDDNAKFSHASTATASLYICNPFKTNKIASLFSTHPPISDRIQALEEMI